MNRMLLILIVAQSMILTSSTMASTHKKNAAKKKPAQVMKKISVIEMQNPHDAFSTSFYPALASALTAQGFQFVPPPATSLDEVVLTLGCGEFDSDCLSKLGSSLDVNVLLIINRQTKPFPLLVHQFFDVKQGIVVQQGALALSDQSTLGAHQAAVEMAQMFGLVPQLEVRSHPAGAQLIVDNKARGKTPLLINSALTTGTHELRLRFDDGFEMQQSITLQKGEQRQILIRRPELLRISETKKSPTGLTIGWSLLAASVVTGLGASIITSWIFMDQAQLNQEQTIGSTAVKSISRSDAKELLVVMQYKTGAAIVTYGISLALAMASATILGANNAQ